MGVVVITEGSKVYCKVCEYYVGGIMKESCDCPKNMVDTYLEPMVGRVFTPDEANANNNCSHYKAE